MSLVCWKFTSSLSSSFSVGGQTYLCEIRHCIYTHVHIYMYTYICIYTHTNIYIYRCLFTCSYITACIHVWCDWLLYMLLCCGTLSGMTSLETFRKPQKLNLRDGHEILPHEILNPTAISRRPQNRLHRGAFLHRVAASPRAEGCSKPSSFFTA